MTNGSSLFRLFDIILATIALICSLPLLLICGILIRVTSKGPVLFKAVRLGKEEALFTMYKLRTMYLCNTLASDITAHEDSRITPIGKFLRRTKIDELPQLINILAGQMSIVGPRPETVGIVEKYYTAEMKLVLDFTPGLTSPGTLHNEENKHLLHENNSDALYAEHILPQRVAQDISYFERRTFKTDFVLILQTLRKILGN